MDEAKIHYIYIEEEPLDVTKIKFITKKGLEAMDESFSYVPEHTRGGIIRWIENGIPPGSFLSAVLENNLFEAFGRADETNAYNLRTIAAWFYNYAPSQCFGSPAKVKSWHEMHMERPN